MNWEATPRRKKKQEEARRKKKKEDNNTLGATGRRSVMTMLLHKSDIVTASYDLICILMSQLEIYISLLLVQNQLRDSRSVNRGGGELLEDAGNVHVASQV